MSEKTDSELGAGVRLITAADREAWDALVMASPCANAFLQSDWLDMLEATDSYGARFVRMGFFDKNNRLRAAWALPYQSHLGFRYSTYFEFYYAGPILDPELESGSVHFASERMRVLQALAEAQARQLHVIEAETHPEMQDIRPFLYAGWTAVPLYTHCWHMDDPETIRANMNREKRRVIKLASARWTFGFTSDARDREAFIERYRELILKFNWIPLPQWDRDLLQRMEWLADRDGGRLFAARDAEGTLCAAVIALLSKKDHTAYLWRCAYRPDPDANTIVPALYWHTACALREEWDAPIQVNFGGSPRPTLTIFKDYLGATPQLHFRLVHDRPGPRTWAWRKARLWKEAARRHVTRAGLLSAWYRSAQRPDKHEADEATEGSTLG